MSKKLSKQEIVENSKNKHGDKYDYSLILDDSFVYENAKQKLPIICHKMFEDGTEHGVFEQDYSHHVCSKTPRGCPHCADIARKEHRAHITDEKFINDAKEVHGDKYDYSLVKGCENNHTKAKIICKKHGIFEQDYAHHVGRRQGCPFCAGNVKSNSEEFGNKADIKHNGKYIYYLVDYKDNDTKVDIICPIHGVFKQTPHEHLEGKGCPICANKLSKSEDEIYNMLTKHFGNNDVEQRNREILCGKEIDIFVKSKNIGIEYNGIRWHSEKFGKDRFYHLNKTLKCNKKGVKLIQIFEDEFIEKYEIVLSKIKQIFGINNDIQKISARKCVIHEISFDLSKSFLEKNHIQGFDRASVYLGCFYVDKLIGVMTFVNEKNGMWNLSRFATDNNYVCRGVGGKLFSYFMRNYNPISIKSFADRRWTLNPNDNFYTKLGFKLESETIPDYKYTKGFKRIHKFNFRKKTLHRKYGFPLSMTEKEMAKELGYYKIWDCGLFKYVWKNPEHITTTETVNID